MPYYLGKTLAVVTLSIISAAIIIHLMENDSTISLMGTTALSRSGIKDLDVEYVGGKIYLNVELNSPKTCPELIESLGIQPIIIKSKTYQPSCSKVSDTVMRVTYTQAMSI
jgi:hypothetical protein